MKTKEVVLTVTVKFSDDLTKPSEVNHVAINVLKGLEKAVNDGHGLAPDNDDTTYTRSITVQTGRFSTTSNLVKG